MSVAEKVRLYMDNPRQLVADLYGKLRFGTLKDDKLYLRLLYRARTGRNLNLDNPTSFNEKLQWLKLYDRNPLYTMLVDKYLVKRWVADRIGEQYVTPTYACWERAEDIDISDLPERFVLKTNHDCGGVVICRDRAKFDLAAAKANLAAHLRTNYYWHTREWPYRQVKPLVFAEEYLEPDSAVGEIVDYKIMCFGGEARCAFTCTGRAEGDLRVDFFDPNWNHLPFTRHYPNADVPPDAPDDLVGMLAAAQELAAGIPFVRVDFYEVAGRRLFGEMTFFPGAGMEEFDPYEWDGRLGSWIDLTITGGGCFLSDNCMIWLHETFSQTSVHMAEMVDYKFYCFEGNPRYLYVSQGLEDHETARISFLDMEWTFAPFGRSDYVSFMELPEKPVCYAEMEILARKLSAGVPFVRVDFFSYKGRPRFSEMTFSPCGGFMPFDPPIWDSRLGDLLDLTGAYGPFQEGRVR